jgi:hypothetical protein
MFSGLKQSLQHKILTQSLGPISCLNLNLAAVRSTGTKPDAEKIPMRILNTPVETKPYGM